MRCAVSVRTETIGLQLVSKPFKKRRGLYPMIFYVAVAFLFSMAWFGMAVVLMMQLRADVVIWGVLIGLSTIVYCSYLAYMGWRLFQDSARDYLLELTETEAILYVVEIDTHKESTQMVLLDDVRYAEYYPFADTASIILHTSYTDMEVPLWPFGSQSRDAVDFLSGRGVPIVNVQTDDRIPD